MTKIYIITHFYPYEGQEIVSVHKTEKGAEIACEEYKNKLSYEYDKENVSVDAHEVLE